MTSTPALVCTGRKRSGLIQIKLFFNQSITIKFFKIMGKINQGILGGVSGTVGSVIGSSWKGISYLRGKAQSHKDANSELQQATRKTFSKLVKLASSLLTSVIKPIWSNKVPQRTGSNIFIKENFGHVNPDFPLVENEGIVLSTGPLPLPENIMVQKNAAVPRGVIISWTDNSGSFMASSDDVLRIVAIAGDSAITVGTAGAMRADENAEIVLPFTEGQTVRVYVFFENSIQSIYSNDVNFSVAI